MDKFEILHWALSYAAQNGEITMAEYKEAADYLLTLEG